MPKNGQNRTVLEIAGVPPGYTQKDRWMNGPNDENAAVMVYLTLYILISLNGTR